MNCKKSKDKNQILQEEAKAYANADKNISVVSYDLQKILTTPKTVIGPLYHMSKLNIWNFTTYDMVNHIGVCNLWNESLGKRGSNEIASFLMKHCTQLLEENPFITEIITFSDNCGGQNKNQNVFTMNAMMAVRKKIKVRQM